MAQDPFHSLHGLRRRLVTGHNSVINYRGRNRASTDTTRSQQRELFVRRSFAPLDSRSSFNRGQHLIAALDIARRAQADHTGVSTLRLEREKVVERGDAVNPARRNMQRGRDKLQGMFIQVAEGLLHRVKNFDQGVRPIIVAAHP